MVNLLLLPTTGSGGCVTDLEQTSLDRKLTTHASTQTGLIHDIFTTNEPKKTTFTDEVKPANQNLLTLLESLSHDIMAKPIKSIHTNRIYNTRLTALFPRL